MEVPCLQLAGASISFLPRVGSIDSRVSDGSCLRVKWGGDYLGNRANILEPSPWTSCSLVVKPFSSVGKGIQRSPCRYQKYYESGKDGRGFRIGEDGDGDIRSTIRPRTSVGSGPGQTASFMTIKVRAFVDEATARLPEFEDSSISSVMKTRSCEDPGEQDSDSDEFRQQPDEDEPVAELDGPARVSGRILDQEGYDEPDQGYQGDEEYDPGRDTDKAKSSLSVDLEYNYEDMKLGEQKDWSMVDMKKLDLLRNFECRHGSENGVFVVQAMRVEHMKATEELLVDSFAELMGGLLTYRPLLALTVRQYVRDRYNCLPDAVTLVGLYAPAEDNVVMGRTENEFSGSWLLAGTVELSFSDLGHPAVPSGPAPPPGSPYLCNMAVTSIYRRRGLGRQLLKAAEELAISMGSQDLYLHCRMVDLAPLNMYRGAGYQIVATDSILSLLSFQRRRYLMRKRLPSLTPISVTV